MPRIYYIIFLKWNTDKTENLINVMCFNYYYILLTWQEKGRSPE